MTGMQALPKGRKLQQRIGRNGMRRQRLGLRQAAARLTHLLLVLSLVMGAHGMAPAVAEKTQGIDLSDYALPDGSLPLLCLPAGGTGDEGGAVSAGHCPYCRTSGDLSVPPFFAQPQRCVLPQVHSLPSGTILPVRQVLRSAASPRGPPAGRS